MDARSHVSGQLRFAWIFAGVILPLVCFAIGYPHRGVQANELSGYAELLLSHEASLPLYPLLLGCMVSMALLAWRPARFAENGWVCAGIFSGTVLTLEYWAVFQVALSDASLERGWLWFAGQCILRVFASAIAVAIPWFGVRLILYAAARMSLRGRIIALPILIVGAVVTLMGPAILCLLCSTPWAVAAYGSAAVWLIRRRKEPFLRFGLWQLLSATSWLAVNFAAWRTAFLADARKECESAAVP